MSARDYGASPGLVTAVKGYRLKQSDVDRVRGVGVAIALKVDCHGLYVHTGQRALPKQLAQQCKQDWV